VVPTRSGSHLTIDILDDGGGLPEGFKMGKQKSLGLAIISTLIADLDGSVLIKNREDARGTVARITLEVPCGG
jgi:two-component sensor histidine kinase